MIRHGLLGLAMILGGILSSPVAHAETSTTWNFMGGRTAEGWQFQGLQVTPAADGLHIRGNGVMIRPVDAVHAIETIDLSFARSVPTTMVLAWHRLNTPPQEFVQMAVPVQAGTAYKQSLPLYKIAEWDPWTDVIALQFQTNEEIVLSAVTLNDWSRWENIVTAWKSFWMKDRMLTFSINFLWGPLVVFTPPELETLYLTQPPNAWSGHRFSYAVLALTLLVLFGSWIMRRVDGRTFIRKPVAAFFAVVAVLWAVHDVRMGYEFAANAVEDLQSFTFGEPGKRTFRNLLTFHDVLDRYTNELTAHPTYALFAPEPSPLRKMALYHTYPHSKPLPAEASTVDQKVFLVFHGGNFALNEKNELMHDGVVVSKPGSIVSQFDDDSFLFLVP